MSGHMLLCGGHIEREHTSRSARSMSTQTSWVMPLIMKNKKNKNPEKGSHVATTFSLVTFNVSTT